MDIIDINFKYEVIFRGYLDKKGKNIDFDTKLMEHLYSTFVDYYYRDHPVLNKEKSYEDTREKMSLSLLKLIENSTISAKKKEDLRHSLLNADIFSIIFVLGELEVLLFD